MKDDTQLQLEEAGFDYDKPDPEAQLCWDLWKKYETARDGLPFLVDGYPFDKANGMQSQAPAFTKWCQGQLFLVESVSAQPSATGGAMSAPRVRCRCARPQTRAFSTSGRTVRP